MNLRVCHWSAAITTIFITLTISRVVWAQDVDSVTRTKAEELFHRADVDMTNKDYARACPQFEEVIALLPDAIGAHEALGECYEALGLTATSWRVYQEALSLAEKKGATERIPVIREKSRRLEGRYSMITVKISEKFAGLVKIKLDLGKHAENESHVNVPIPVDRGTHIVDVYIVGKPSKQHEVVMKNDGEHARIQVQDPVDEPNHSPISSSSRAWAKPLGWSLVGLGGVALATGGVLDALATQNNAASNDGIHCTSTNLCDSIGWPLRDRAVAQANASIGMLIAGGILTTGGFVVALVLPQKPKQNLGATHWQISVFPTGLTLYSHF